MMIIAHLATSFLPAPEASSSAPNYESAKACAIVVDDDEEKKQGNIKSSLRNPPPDGTSFSQISLSQRLSKTLSPYGYWNVQFYQAEAGYVNFALELPRGASFGLYARKNALPTHTNYDIMEVVKGSPADSPPRGTQKRAIRVRTRALPA